MIANSQDKPCPMCRGWGVVATPKEYVSWDHVWNFKVDRLIRFQLKRGQRPCLPIASLTRFIRFLIEKKKPCSYCNGLGLAKMLSSPSQTKIGANT